MTEEIDFYELLAKLRDMHNGAAEALDSFIQKKTKVELAVLAEHDLEKIKWEDKTGQKGPFQATDDVNALEYKVLRKELADHKGFVFHKGFQYWVFQNGTTIGRRKKA